MTPYVDLHLHTNHSDGTDTPSEVVSRALQHGIVAMAISDHDTVSGVPEARAAAEAQGIEYLCATEISSRFNEMEVHIVGLGIDITSPVLLEALVGQKNSRNARAERIVEELHKAGVPVEWARIVARTADGVVGRMHIAQEIHDLGFSQSVQDSFERYIGRGQRAFVRKSTMTSAEAIDLIHEARGLAILAHPGIGAPQRMLSRLLRLPFDGIEAYHCKHTPGQIEEFSILARELGLLISGGSDCHGQAKLKPEMGNVRVPYEHFTRLKEVLATRK
ncbi:MAG: PHP domain-containing protein [FCB group bacterium]|jgi:predicted metal-dependent phosphoesterase TrpH|nr:PHP domain-containing protein [FCB group bacterium]